MDNYKFGNLICSMRESKNLTQREFANLLYVSDKAVSKWENGQAIPRMDTLEKMAEVLGTSVEEIISMCKDNIKRIHIVNTYGNVLHFQIDDEIISLNTEEKKSILVDSTKESYQVKVYGEIRLESILDEGLEEPKNFKDSLVQKGIKKMSRWVDKQVNRQFIQTKCFYTLSNVKDEEKIEVEPVFFSAGDKMWISKDLAFSYPKLNCSCEVTLTNAECINKADAFADFRRQALTSELGISIPLMLIAYPFRKMYFKSILKPKGLMKYLSKADYYVAKNEKASEKNKKIKHPIIKGIGIIFLLIIALIGGEIVTGIMNVDVDKPYLIASDYSQITYSREIYKRVDELPKDAVPEKLLGAQVWTDARMDGLSKSDQYFDLDHKVCTFTDKNGNTYLWLVMNYMENIIDENGEDKEYEDFDEHYVYMLHE